MPDDALGVIVCGSSAAVALPGYLSRLRRSLPHTPLRVLLTAAAERFVRPEVVGWYADVCVTTATDGFNPTEFASSSGGITVLPASANTLACTALGLAGTPAQTALLVAEPPVLFFPSMNRTMWSRSSVLRHVAALRAEGHTVVDPSPGEAYEIWQRKIVSTLVMPGPEPAVEVITTWWEERKERHG
ncbi:flavoprotein [Streptomyces sp. NPDC020951]|uniref:flavoprotein n=1 Tax=Streptomyces sp. NPDC020951 TaxID=3365104 RepID=UPI00378C8ED1